MGTHTSPCITKRNVTSLNSLRLQTHLSQVEHLDEMNTDGRNSHLAIKGRSLGCCYLWKMRKRRGAVSDPFGRVISVPSKLPTVLLIKTWWRLGLEPIT